jgi:hypothetical protein
LLQQLFKVQYVQLKSTCIRKRAFSKENLISKSFFIQQNIFSHLVKINRISFCQILERKIFILDFSEIFLKNAEDGAFLFGKICSNIKSIVPHKE